MADARQELLRYLEPCEADAALDALEPHLREAVATAFMAGVKFGGQLPTLTEIAEERDWRAGKAVKQWRSAR